MIYYVHEEQINDGVRFTAGIKARDDVEQIWFNDNYKKLELVWESSRTKQNPIKRIVTHIQIMNKWNQLVNQLSSGDTILLQFPIVNHTLFFNRVLKHMKSKGIQTILLIHDLELFRAALRKNTSFKTNIRLNIEERSILKIADMIIVHNNSMKHTLIKMGVPEKKLVSLQIFDYLVDEIQDNIVIDKNDPVIIAGNLRKHKAGYVYNLPNNVEFNLYGIDYTAKQENAHYFGAFPADELPSKMVGSFGLVWDGPSSNTCEDVYGEYLKINNPHKTSLYLACGIPVIIWKEAALAKFIQKNECGLLVDSLDEIENAIQQLSDEQYNKLRLNAKKISERLKKGYYTNNAVKACLHNQK